MTTATPTCTSRAPIAAPCSGTTARSSPKRKRAPPSGPSAGTRAPLPAHIDRDGRPDLVVSGYVDEATRIPEATQGFPNTYAGRRDLLFLNEGDREFREVGREAGLEVVRFGYGLGVVLADFERDGDLDVHLANDTNPNRLYENVPWPGGAAADPAGLGFRFEERAAAAGVADPGAGMGVAIGDWDTDGRSDIFVSNSRGQGHALYRSNPPDANDPSFTDVRRRRDRPRALHRWEPRGRTRQRHGPRPRARERLHPGHEPAG